jgi:RNA polymerase sigma factor (sigma-70 family)
MGSESQTAPFVIRRLPPAGGGPVRVHFDLTTIYRQGDLRSRSHAVTLPARGQSVAIPGQWMYNGSGSEIVMLKVRSNPAYLAQPASVSWFVPGAASLCSDAALLRAYLHGGCQQAFTALVQQHQPQVLQICRQILRNYADAEDVTQTVFLMLATRPPKSDQSLPGWLHTVARNAAISYLRSRTRRAHHEAEAARELATQSAGTPEIPSEELEAALARLRNPFQKAVRLRYLHDYSQQEAAELMGCPRGTLAQRAARGIMQLRQILKQALNSE